MKDSILIIGPADTNCYLNQIVKCTIPSNVHTAFDLNSKLGRAYQTAYRAGIANIYLANVRTKDNYINICQMIDEKQYDVIVPIGLYVTDEYVFDDKRRPIICIMLELLHPTQATLVTSHIHASAYDTVEHFIADMNKMYCRLQSHVMNKNDSAHLVFVANHLNNVDFAQVDLGVAMVKQVPGQYVTGDFNTPLFYLEATDFAKGVVFFRNNYLCAPTVENYYNLSQSFPEKNICVQQIINYVHSKLNLNQFKGKRMNKSIIVMQIKMYLQAILEQLKQECITAYHVKKIDIISERNSYVIVCYIDIVPYFSFETSEVVLTERM